MAHFQIFKSDKSTAYYYRLRSTNNQEIILESEGYATKFAAMQAIDSAKSTSRFDQYYELKEGIFYSFALKAGNGETLGRSRKYMSANERDSAMKLVKKEAPNAVLEDLT